VGALLSLLSACALPGLHAELFVSGWACAAYSQRFLFMSSSCLKWRIHNVAFQCISSTHSGGPLGVWWLVGRLHKRTFGKDEELIVAAGASQRWLGVVQAQPKNPTFCLKRWSRGYTMHPAGRRLTLIVAAAASRYHGKRCVEHQPMLAWEVVHGWSCSGSIRCRRFALARLDVPLRPTIPLCGFKWGVRGVAGRGLSLQRRMTLRDFEVHYCLQPFMFLIA